MNNDGCFEMSKLETLNQLCKKWKRLTKTNPTSDDIVRIKSRVDEIVGELLVDFKTTDAIKAELKKLDETSKKKNKIKSTCRRCGGSGVYMDHGVCFGCNGSGKTYTKYGMTQKLWKERIEHYSSGGYDKSINEINAAIEIETQDLLNTNHAGMKDYYQKRIDAYLVKIDNIIKNKAEFDEDFAKYGNGDFPVKLLDVKFNTSFL